MTVNVVEPVIPESVAEIAVVPAATVVASPYGEIVAAAVLDEAQVTCVVRSTLLPFE
ncbi:hypothetical protein PSR1_02233 [Anaeromyxobacter sp. PSR-1]|nr:hypothetical protein PSR1_02233 [Anaeromyxobacter sp. PSR-1]